MKIVLKMLGLVLALVTCVAILLCEVGCSLLFAGSEVLTQEQITSLLDQTQITDMLGALKFGDDENGQTELQRLTAAFLAAGYSEESTTKILNSSAMREIANQVALHALFGAIYADADMFATADEVSVLVTERAAFMLTEAGLDATDGDQVVLSVFLSKELGVLVGNVTLEKLVDEKTATVLGYISLALNRQTRFTMISLILILALAVMLFLWRVIKGLRWASVATFFAGATMLVAKLFLDAAAGGALTIAGVDISTLTGGALGPIVPALADIVGSLMTRYALITMAAGAAAFLLTMLFYKKKKSKKRSVSVVAKN